MFNCYANLNKLIRIKKQNNIYLIFILELAKVKELLLYLSKININNMTKRDLIKKILELGKKLEKANGLESVMIVNDMEFEVDNYAKQFPIHNIVRQSEQLVCDQVCDWFSVGHQLNGHQECRTCGKQKAF